MMKGSSSTILCALVGLTALLSVVNEAQGWKCHSGERGDYSVQDCNELPGGKCEPGQYQGCGISTNPNKKYCACYTKNVDECDIDGAYFCRADLCNMDYKTCSSGGGGGGGDDEYNRGKGGGYGGRGGATTSTLAISTLFSAFALVIITPTLF